MAGIAKIQIASVCLCVSECMSLNKQVCIIYDSLMHALMCMNHILLQLMRIIG